MIMSIGSNLWLPIALSLVAFGSFSWALRGHFETSIRIPNGMRLLSFFSFFSYMTFIGLLVWRGSESPVRTALGLVGFAVSITLFWWTVSTTRPHRLAVAYTNAVPDIIYVEGPYARVRHPFYLSYILFWFATAVVADQWQWAPALILIFWVHPSRQGRGKTLSIIGPFDSLRRLSRANRHVPAASWARRAMTRPMLGGEPIRALWDGATAILQRLLALRRLFRSYLGTTTNVRFGASRPRFSSV